MKLVNHRIFNAVVFTLMLITLSLLIAISKGNNARAEERPEINPQLASCLKEKMGAETYDAIKSGTQKPTEDEGKIGEECFTKYGTQLKTAPKQNVKPQFSATAKTCLKQKLGDDYEDQFKNIKSDVEGKSLAEKAKSCFGDKEGKGDIPPSVKQCIVKNVGQNEADKMFQGDKPSKDSDIYKKLDGAGCFKGFQSGGGKGKMEDIPPEKRQCIEGIMGNVNGEPTEEQKQLVGTKCFGGSKPGEGSHQALPENVEKCLKAGLGDSFKDKSPDAMSAEEKNKAGECFKQNNFQPEGTDAGAKAPGMNETTKQCIEKLTGKPLSARPEIDDNTKSRINSECFAGKADKITGEGGASGRSKDEQQSCVKNIAGDNPGPYTGALADRINKECFHEQQTEKNDNPRAQSDKQTCVDKLSNDTSTKMTYEEKQAQINKECYSDLKYGQPNGGSFDPSRQSDDGGANKQREQRVPRESESGDGGQNIGH